MRKLRDTMTHNGELLRAYSAIAKREERERVAKGLAVVKAARKKGLPVKAATIEGVTLEFGEPEAAPATFNEWDQDLGTHPPQIRQ
jgi:hypothetical protein